MRITLGVAAAALAWSMPSTAQISETVSAGDPQGLVKLLEVAGFEPELGKDDTGDPKVVIKVSGYRTAIYFYGCDAKTHAGCDSLQFQSAFDRKDPWPAKEVAAVARKWRHAAVWLDDEGDPFITWDLPTGDGIPSKVLLQGVRAYGDALQNIAGEVFPDDGSQNTSK